MEGSTCDVKHTGMSRLHVRTSEMLERMEVTSMQYGKKRLERMEVTSMQ
jgi:hypothetical protein